MVTNGRVGLYVNSVILNKMTACQQIFQ